MISSLVTASGAGAQMGNGAHYGVGFWVLWGVVALLLAAVYVGVYVWMRRPKEGRRPRPPRAGSSAGSPHHPSSAG